MKYVCLSFDDARADTYNIAYPIMKKYGLVATVNVISDYVLNERQYHFDSSPKAMTREQIKEWYESGYEVACHGSTHQNTVEDILKNIKELKSFGISTKEIGFASPESWLTEKNIYTSGIASLCEMRGGGFHILDQVFKCAEKE